MNTRKAAPVIFTMSVVVLIGGGAGTAALGAPVRDDRSPTIVGFARGHVIVKDDLSPIRNAGGVLGITAAAQGTPFSADALRELHSRGPAPQSVPGFSAEVLRELKGSAPRVESKFTGDVRRELHSTGVAPQSAREISTEARRELHAGAPVPQSAAADVQGWRLAAYAEAAQGSDQTSASEMQGKRLAAYADALGAR